MTERNARSEVSQNAVDWMDDTHSSQTYPYDRLTELGGKLVYTTNKPRQDGTLPSTSRRELVTTTARLVEIAGVMGVDDDRLAVAIRWLETHPVK